MLKHVTFCEVELRYLYVCQAVCNQWYFCFYLTLERRLSSDLSIYIKDQNNMKEDLKKSKTRQLIWLCLMKDIYKRVKVKRHIIQCDGQRAEILRHIALPQQKIYKIITVPRR